MCNAHVVLADDWLLVGTKPGHLLLYRIKKDPGLLLFVSAAVLVFSFDLLCDLQSLV